MDTRGNIPHLIALPNSQSGQALARPLLRQAYSDRAKTYPCSEGSNAGPPQMAHRRIPGTRMRSLRQSILNIEWNLLTPAPMLSSVVLNRKNRGEQRQDCD